MARHVAKDFSTYPHLQFSHFLLDKLFIMGHLILFSSKLKCGSRINCSSLSYRSQAITDLHTLFLKNDIKKLSSESFRDNAHAQMKNLKVSRILKTQKC